MNENFGALTAHPSKLIVIAVQAITVDVDEEGVVGTLSLRNRWHNAGQRWEVVARLDGRVIVNDGYVYPVVAADVSPAEIAVARRYAEHFDSGTVVVDEPDIETIAPVANPRTWTTDDGLVEVRFRTHISRNWRIEMENVPTWRGSGGANGHGGNGKITNRTIEEARVTGKWDSTTSSWELNTDLHHTSVLKNGRRGQSSHPVHPSEFPELRVLMMEAVALGSGVRVSGIHD